MIENITPNTCKHCYGGGVWCCACADKDKTNSVVRRYGDVNCVNIRCDNNTSGFRDLEPKEKARLAMCIIEKAFADECKVAGLLSNGGHAGTKDDVPPSWHTATKTQEGYYD